MVATNGRGVSMVIKAVMKAKLMVIGNNTKRNSWI
jgi:hypothetical protein